MITLDRLMTALKKINKKHDLYLHFEIYEDGSGFLRYLHSNGFYGKWETPEELEAMLKKAGAA